MLKTLIINRQLYHLPIVDLSPQLFLFNAGTVPVAAARFFPAHMVRDYQGVVCLFSTAKLLDLFAVKMQVSKGEKMDFKQIFF